MNQPSAPAPARTRSRQRNAFLCILVCTGFSFLWSCLIVRSSSGRLGDFKAIYFGARCLILHRDPYLPSQFLRVYQSRGGILPTDPAISRAFRRAIPICINLPTSLLLTAPLAALPWTPAFILWMALEFALLTLAGYLTWDLANLASDTAVPGLSLALVCLVLANCELLFSCGNLAGIVVSLCVIAFWCFLNQRFVLAGILCLAISLALKPHDAGFLWLLLLLSGSHLRKRALQTLLVAFAIGASSVLWVAHTAPHWLPEMRTNLAATSARGDLNDPGPTSLSGHSPASIIDLQTVISLIRDRPTLYNPASYILCGTLLLAGFITQRSAPASLQRTCFALAWIVPLSMLITYHRPYDAKLLLLTIPACAVLSSHPGPARLLAPAFTAASILFTGDIPLAILSLITQHPPGAPAHPAVVMASHAAPLVLLATALFYLRIASTVDAQPATPYTAFSPEREPGRISAG